jgi:hypothetical protein
MGLLDFLHRKPSISDLNALEDFLDRRTAFMVQKCIFEYSRARSGLLSEKLFKEGTFRQAVEEARWRNYPLCLQSVALMIEHALRPHAPDDPGPMRRGLVAAVGNVCARYPVPEGFESEFWVDAEERIARRLHQAGLAAPHAIKDIPRETAREFFDNLPMHADVRAFDFELITNNLRANLCRAHEDFIAVADRPALVSVLAARVAEPAPADAAAERA